MIKNLLPILLFAFGFASCGSTNPIDPNSRSIQDAHNAYFQMDLATSYAIFSNVFNDSTKSDEDRSVAGIYKAKMEWLFHRDFNLSFKTLDQCFLTSDKLTDIHLMKARILADEGKIDEAIVETERAMAEARTETETYDARYSYFQYTLKNFEVKVQENGRFDTDEKDLLTSVYKEIISFSTPRPGDVNLAKLLLGYAILAQDGPKLFEAWMSYYRLTKVNQIHPSLIEEPEVFKATLLNYDSTVSNAGQIERTIKFLAESGFYSHAAMLAKYRQESVGSSDPEIKEINAYYDFLRKTEENTNNLYIEIASGDFSKKDYEKAFYKEGEILWNKLNWPGNTPEFSEEGFDEEITTRFKAIVKMMTANGYYGLHMGHKILDEERTISQHGETAKFRYLAIDHMVSNGYSAWFWDGIAQTGGWASDDESFLQVRSAYTSGPVKSYTLVTDSAKRAERISDIERLTQVDDSIASINPHAFLPGLSARIDFNEKEELFDSLKSSGLDGSALRLAFINGIEKIKQESSIFAHEGRHSIDKKNGYSKNAEKLEYTAKLSEVFYSQKPFYAFTSILSRNIGDKTSHGQANYKVIKGLVKWMERNQNTIEGFDASKPTFPQLDRLTDTQLKMAVKSLDPLAEQ